MQLNSVYIAFSILVHRSQVRSITIIAYFASLSGNNLDQWFCLFTDQEIIKFRKVEIVPHLVEFQERKGLWVAEGLVQL